MKRTPGSPTPASRGLMEPPPLPSGDSPVSNKSSFPPSFSRGITGVPCLLLVYFHKNLQSLLFVKTSL